MTGCHNNVLANESSAEWSGEEWRGVGSVGWGGMGWRGGVRDRNNTVSGAAGPDALC